MSMFHVISFFNLQHLHALMMVETQQWKLCAAAEGVAAIISAIVSLDLLEKHVKVSEKSQYKISYNHFHCKDWKFLLSRRNFLTLSDPGEVLFAQPSRVNWLLIFYGWAYQIHYLNWRYLHCLQQLKKILVSNLFEDLNFLKRSKYTLGLIGLMP